MLKGEVSSDSSSTSRSVTCSDSRGLQLDLIGNDGFVGSLGSDRNPKTKTIAIALEAHKTLHLEPFSYAINHLVERKNCKVVVVCCLSRVQSEMGVDYKIDVESFAGVNKKILEKAIVRQINNINHFLRRFRADLDHRGVLMEIRIPAGPKSVDILVQAAKALHPHWLVLDRSFSVHQKTLQSQLECNLVMMKRPPTLPTLIQLSSKYLGPVEVLPDGLSVDDMGPIFAECITPSLPSMTSSSGHKPGGTSSRMSQQLNVSVSKSSRTVTSNSTAKTFSCFTCLCLSIPDSTVDQDGPTKDRTVLYGDTLPGSKAVYLGGMGRLHPSIPEEEVNLPTYKTTPLSSPTSAWANSSPRNAWFNSAIGTASKRTNKKSVKNIEAELEARMAMPPEEEDVAYQVQL